MGWNITLSEFLNMTQDEQSEMVEDFCEKDPCIPWAVYGDDDHPAFDLSMSAAVKCYKRVVMSRFEQINAYWITYNANCDPEKLDWKVSDESVKNLKETHLEVYSGSKCTEKFPNM